MPLNVANMKPHTFRTSPHPPAPGTRGQTPRTKQATTHPRAMAAPATKRLSRTYLHSECKLALSCRHTQPYPLPHRLCAGKGAAHNTCQACRGRMQDLSLSDRGLLRHTPSSITQRVMFIRTPASTPATVELPRLQIRRQHSSATTVLVLSTLPLQPTFEIPSRVLWPVLCTRVQCCCADRQPCDSSTGTLLCMQYCR